MQFETPSFETRHQFWEYHVSCWSSSDWTQTRYCEAHGINPQSFSNWKRRIRHSKVKGETRHSLIPLEVSSFSAGGSVSMWISEKIRLEVTADSDLQIVKNLVSLLVH